MQTEDAFSTILAHEQPLSQSILWEIQRRYFLRSGMAAWQTDEVPHAISCNPYMARTYSRLIFGYLHDCMAAVKAGELQWDANQPLYFIELGAGSGRLTYHFLHQFYADYLDSPFADWPVKFVLTDFVPQTVAFWRDHAQLNLWVEAGLLDFALFDITNPQPLELVCSGERLTPEQVQNPLVLFANYFFDSIPQDSFVTEDGEVYDNLLTVRSNRPEPDLDDPTLWERLRFDYIMGDAASYNNPVYNQILRDYATELPDTILTFPNVGLDGLQFWQQFGRGRVLLLTADRGNTRADSLVTDKPPLPNLHGSFSLMVNYHAIGAFVLYTGGHVYESAHYQNNLQVVAYHLGQIPFDGLETERAFKIAVAGGGPDDFFALKSALGPIIGQLSLPQLLSFLRLSVWDADLFRTCYPTLLARAVGEAPTWNDDVYNAALSIWEQYLPIHQNDDLENLIGLLFEAIGIQ